MIKVEFTLGKLFKLLQFKIKNDTSEYNTKLITSN